MVDQNLTLRGIGGAAMPTVYVSHLPDRRRIPADFQGLGLM